MELAQLKTYTEKDYYSLPEDVRSDQLNAGIYDDLWIDFKELDL